MQGKRGGISALLVASVREVVFGLEDSFVSTLGTISGVAVGSGDAKVVILSGLVLVVVEAVSMAAGSYLSSQAATELYEERMKQDAARVLSERVSDNESLKDLFDRKGFKKEEIKIALEAISRERKLWLTEVKRTEYRMSPGTSGSPFLAGVVMGVCYVLGGLLVLLPYFIVPLGFALAASVVITFVSLFILGFWKAKIAGVKPFRSGVEMVTVSLGAAILGILIGQAFSVYDPK
jgi:predicted membrane protein (TIGR00267 family)